MSAAAAGGQRRVRPLRDRALWRLAGHGGWVATDELARVLGCEPAALEPVLAALRADGVIAFREVVGWRIEGPELAREAARDLVRSAAKDGARCQVLTRVEGATVLVGMARVLDAPRAAFGDGLGLVLVALRAPLPAGEDGLQRLQALVNRWSVAMSDEGVLNV